MKSLSLNAFGGLSLIVGSLLFAIYVILIAPLFSAPTGTLDFVQVVLNPRWRPLALVALISIVLMLIGFYAIYIRIRVTTGIVGTLGFLFMEAAFILQACKVTWELFLYPIIASHPESTFLFRDRLIIDDPWVKAFYAVSAVTILIGIVLFSWALQRSKEFPKAASVLIFIGALVYAAGPMISAFASIAGVLTLSVGCLLLGLQLLKPQHELPTL